MQHERCSGPVRGVLYLRVMVDFWLGSGNKMTWVVIGNNLVGVKIT